MKVTDMFVATKEADNCRICGACQEQKPLSAFYKDGKDSKGNAKFRRDCKDCYKKARMHEAKLKSDSKTKKGKR